MSFDAFENKLSRQPMRQIPLDWRREILQAAAPASPSSPPAAPWWREWLWPWPQAWAGVAAVWVLVLALHFASASPEPNRTGFARVEWGELRHQQELLAHLLAPPEPSEPAEPTKSPAHAEILHRKDLKFA